MLECKFQNELHNFNVLVTLRVIKSHLLFPVQVPPMFSSPEPTVSNNLYSGQGESGAYIACKPFAPRSGSDSFYEDIAQLVSSSISPASSPDVDDDLSSSPVSPTNPSPIYYYVDSAGPSFGSPSSPAEMYDTDPPSAYPTSSSIYQQPLRTPQNTYSFATVSDIRESDEPASYPSDSPSPGDVHSSADFSHSYTEPHSQHPHISSYQTDIKSHYNPPTQTPFSRESFIETASASNTLPSNLLDQRRMSEPAILAAPNAYSTASGTDSSSRYSYPMAYNNSSRSSYAPSLQRGASIGSLRDLRNQHQQLHYSSSRSHTGWKTEEDSHHMVHGTHATEGLESPLSPFQPSFPGGVPVGDSPTMAQGIQYSPIAEDPSSNPHALSRPSAPRISTSDMAGDDGDTDGNRSPLDPNSKTYSFVALPGNTVKKRPRRRYDEIERLYQCSWPDCNKAYGTLNHLNAHVTMQKHGSKRSPNGT